MTGQVQTKDAEILCQQLTQLNERFTVADPAGVQINGILPEPETSKCILIRLISFGPRYFWCEGLSRLNFSRHSVSIYSRFTGVRD